MMERDISHWTEWSDIELIEMAACACQRKDLVDDEITRDAIAMNVIAPFRQKLAALAIEARRAIDPEGGVVACDESAGPKDNAQKEAP